MTKKIIYTLCGITAFAVATAAITTPLVIKSKSQDSNKVVNIHNDLDSKTFIKNGQNSLKLKVEANHKNGDQLKYQWFYRNPNDQLGQRINNFKVFDLNESGKTNSLHIVDDIENYHDYEFLCLAYSNNGDYLTNNAFK